MNNPLLDAFNSLPKEAQDNLGKVSSKISNPGVHAVTIKSMIVKDNKFLEIVFEDAAGQTVDYTGYLVAKDPSKQEATTNRVMNQLTAICNAAGLDRNQVLARAVEGTITYGNGSTVPTVTYPLAAGKALNITTYTEIQADAKDANKAWKNQVVDVFKFFDTKKRNALEIASNADEGVSMEAADAEAKARFEIAYSDTNNKACKDLLATLKGTSTQSTPAEVVGDDEI